MTLLGSGCPVVSLGKVPGGAFFGSAFSPSSFLIEFPDCSGLNFHLASDVGDGGALTSQGLL